MIAMTVDPWTDTVGIAQLVTVNAWTDLVGIAQLMTAVTVNAWTDVVGIALLVIAVVSAASIDRSVMLRRAVGVWRVVISVVSTVALVAVVVGRFIALA